MLPPPLRRCILAWLSPLVLMLALHNPALAQSKAGASRGPGSGPHASRSEVTASQTTICQGGSAVLTAGPVFGPSTTYVWSPNQDLSAVSGPEVVVSPLETTTYTVAITANGVTTLGSVTITVKANCCQQATARNIVELSNYYGYNANLPFNGDPFRTYPSGTYFHVAGPSLTLNNTIFILPAGSVLLMDAGADVILDYANFILDGGTITAACGDMWGRLLQPSNNHGIQAKAVGTLRPRLLHSRGGLVLEAQGTPSLIPYHLDLHDMDFLHNYQSLTLGFGASPAVSQDAVTNCRFDSNPALLKSPYQPSGSNYWFSEQHVSLLGDAGLMSFADNTLQHALLGINLVGGTSLRTAILLNRCQFSEVYLAGVFSYDQFPKSNSALRVQSSYFTFPPGSALPATSQVAQVQAQYNSTLRPKETVGLSPLFVPTTVTDGTVFKQPNTSVCPDFNYANYRPRQIGIASQKLNQVLDNTFSGLAVGIAHSLRDGNTNTEVRGNAFTECEKGYDVVPVVNPAPTAPTGTAYVSCNTFARGVSASVRNGVSYGIYQEATAYVTLANPNVNGDPILKNRFDDAGAGVAGFYALYNANTTQSLSYETFDDYRITPLSVLVNAQVALPSHPTAINYQNNGTDCAPLTPNGLPRAAAASAAPVPVVTPVQLEQNVPNPAMGTTRIAYRVPTTAHSVILYVRWALDGQIVEAIPVPANGRYHDLKLSAYPAGMYLYSLVVDGVPSLTRRLVVQ